MIQQVMTEPGRIEFQEVPMPIVSDDQVLVRIHRIGICGSDIHVYHGKHPFTSYPVTQGHEAAGEVIEVGTNVIGFKVGEKVTIRPQLTCDKCHPCRHGKYNLCEELKVMGFQDVGIASEYVAIKPDNLVLLPKEMSYDEGAMIEPLAVAVHAVRQLGDMQGLDLIILGAGPIGNLVAQVAKGMGARKVMITDISDFRLQKAKECGIDIVINTKEQDLQTAILQHFGPDKADAIIDCAGNNTTINQAIRCARKGSIILLVAVFDGLATVDLAVLNDHELDLKTTMMYKEEDYLQAIKMVEEKTINLMALVTGRYSFNKYLEAYQFIDQNAEKSLKILIEL